MTAPFFALQLLADVALGGYVYLLIQHKQRAQEQQAKVRFLGSAYREPAPYFARSSFPLEPQRQCSRTARVSCRCARPLRTSRWITRRRSPLPALTPAAILEQKHAAREITLSASRRAIRSCATAIRAVHRREFREARELIAVAAAYLAEAESALGEHADVRYAGFLNDAKKEFAEANLTLAFVAGLPMPTAAELGVDVQPFLNGMAEAASELRRQVLDCLRRDEGAEAERLLAVMDDVYGSSSPSTTPMRSLAVCAGAPTRARRARTHPR